MRIIQVVQKPQLRGAEIFACQLSNHLLQLGHEVLMVSIFLGDAELPFEGRVINLNRKLSKRFYDINAWNSFNKIVKDFKPTVIQANAADTLKFVVSSKLLFYIRTPLIYRNANKMGDFIKSNLVKALNHFYISKLDYVISVSKECEKDFIKTFRFSQNKIRTVEIGVEDRIIKKKPLFLEEIKTKANTVFCHIGSFVPEKNHVGLIRIFAEVVKKYPDSQLVLIGKGHLMPEVMKFVSEKEISKNVHFLEYRTDVLEILYFSDAFLLPSLIEGLPAVILEAMYTETAVVAYTVGGIQEVVQANKTGWLVKKNKEGDFLESILELMEKPEKKKLFESNAKEMITNKFLNRKIAKRFEEVYFKCSEL